MLCEHLGLQEIQAVFGGTGVWEATAGEQGGGNTDKRHTHKHSHMQTHTPRVPADVVHSEAWLTPGVQHGHQLLLQVPVAADEGLGQRQFVLQDERHAHLQGETEEQQL